MRTFSIVLADDEPQILHGMLGGIPWEQLGFSVAATAGNGQEALEYVQKLHPDLLISDIKMPFLDGLELARILHDALMHIKIVLFSGWDDFEYARRAISYGVSEYVLKPIDFEEMQQLLSKLHAELEEEYDFRTNRQRQEKIYQQSLPLLRQQFFTQLLQGKITQEYAAQQMELLDLSFTYPAYAVALMQTQNNEDILTQISVQQIVEEMLGKVCTVYSFGMYEQTVYLLGLPDTNSSRLILKSLEEAAHMSQRMLKAKFSCGLGLCCDTWMQLETAYAQAKDALEYNVVAKEDVITYYGDVTPNNRAQEPDWTCLLEPLELAVKHGNTEKISGEVKKLLEAIQKHKYSFNEYQLIILDIIFSLSKLYRRYQIQEEDGLAGSKHMVMRILSLRTGEELNNWLYNYCDFTSRSIQKQQTDQNAILANQARDYVDNHFSQPDLSVETMCQLFNVSASHFSKVFRREIGTSFLNYLTQRRLDEAARLLTETEEKSRVIGEMVGYPEPNYFSYVFKKNRGVSPAKYRKQEQANA